MVVPHWGGSKIDLGQQDRLAGARPAGLR